MFETSELNLRDRRTEGLVRMLFLVMTVLLVVPVILILVIGLVFGLVGGAVSFIVGRGFDALISG